MATWTQEMFDIHDQHCPFGEECGVRAMHALSQETNRAQR